MLAAKKMTVVNDNASENTLTVGRLQMKSNSHHVVCMAGSVCPVVVWDESDGTVGLHLYVVEFVQDSVEGNHFCRRMLRWLQPRMNADGQVAKWAVTAAKKPYVGFTGKSFLSSVRYQIFVDCAQWHLFCLGQWDLQAKISSVGRDECVQSVVAAFVFQHDFVEVCAAGSIRGIDERATEISGGVDCGE